MNGAAELEPTRPLRGKPNDSVLAGLEVRAFDPLCVRDDAVPFDLSQVSLQHNGAEVVPNVVLVRDRHHDGQARHQCDAGGYECGVFDRHFDLLLGLPNGWGQCQSEE